MQIVRHSVDFVGVLVLGLFIELVSLGVRLCGGGCSGYK